MFKVGDYITLKGQTFPMLILKAWEFRGDIYYKVDNPINDINHVYVELSIAHIREDKLERILK